MARPEGDYEMRPSDPSPATPADTPEPIASRPADGRKYGHAPLAAPNPGSKPHKEIEAQPEALDRGKSGRIVARAFVAASSQAMSFTTAAAAPATAAIEGSSWRGSWRGTRQVRA